MAVEEAIYTRLSGHAGLSALVGTRISPNKKPQDVTLPAVSFDRISAQRFSAMSVDSGVVKARFQIDVWAATYESASDVRDQVRDAMQRWNTTVGTTIQDVYITNEVDLYEDDIDQHHIVIEIEVNYLE